MSSNRPSRKDIDDLCNAPGPGDGLDPRFDPPLTGDRQIGRKTLQLCGQVGKTLMEVLASCADEVLRELEVVSVVPAAGVGRLLVTLQPSPSAAPRDLEVVEQHLGRAQGMLRNEVVAAIHRRKAPEMILRVVERPRQA